MSRLQALWADIHSSLWFLPAVLVVLAVAAAYGSIELDRRLPGDLRAGAGWFAFGVGADGARGVLTAIAGSIITVTGVVFSVTVVALQLASTQFTPRVLRNFTEDRANHLVLGVFIATFTYALVVLRTVRSSQEGMEPFVPSVSVSIAVVLALVSIGFLIFFIHHITASIRISTILQRVTADTVHVARRLFPEEIGSPAGDDEDETALTPDGAPIDVCARKAGYIQAIDEDALFALATNGQVVVRMDQAIGAFVLPGEILATIWPASDGSREALSEQIHAAFVLGAERTPRQDVERGIIEIVDVAVKALSPGINDPTTAAMCIDRLGEVLVTVGTRGFPARVRTDPEGRIRFIACRTTFRRLVDIAVDPIRVYGADSPGTLWKLIDTIGRIGAQVPAHRREPLLAALDRIRQSAEAALDDPADRAAVGEWTRAARAQLLRIENDHSDTVPAGITARRAMRSPHSPA